MDTETMTWSFGSQTVGRIATPTLRYPPPRIPPPSSSYVLSVYTSLFMDVYLFFSVCAHYHQHCRGWYTALGGRRSYG